MGPAFKFQHSIKLMSDRLPNRAALGAALAPVAGGDLWNLTMEFVVKGEEKQHGEGFGLWLSQNELLEDVFDHLNEKDRRNNVFGYGVRDPHPGQVRRPLGRRPRQPHGPPVRRLLPREDRQRRSQPRRLLPRMYPGLTQRRSASAPSSSTSDSKSSSATSPALSQSTSKTTTSKASAPR